MDQDFFGDTTVQTQQAYNPPMYAQMETDQNQEDQFDFADGTTNMQANNYSINQAEEDEAIIRMREQEERIQEKLRQKANEEYELKQSKREEARKQLEEFMDRKHREKEERKQQNIGKQQKILEQNKQQSEGQGWSKVASNISLKQGEHPGKKQVNRMRESIVNKRNDEKN